MSDRHSFRLLLRSTWAAFGALMAPLVHTPAMAQNASASIEIVTPPTPDVFSLSVSPNGRELLYVSAQDGPARLWLSSLDSGQPRALNNTQGARFPFWSPDGKYIAFFADGKLRRMDPHANDAPKDIADAPAGRGGAWSTTDTILFAPSNVVGIMQVSASGGAVTPVTQLEEGQGSHRWPQFLPGEQRFLFTVASPRQDQRGVYLTSLEDAKPVRILAGETAGVYHNGNLVYVSADGKLLTQRLDIERAKLIGEPKQLASGVATDGIIGYSAFTIANDGTLIYRPGALADKRQFTWFDRSGKTVGTIGAVDTAGPGNPEMSPDGKFVAHSRTIQSNADIWLLDMMSGELKPFTTAASFELEPLWSPDSKRIVFRSNRNTRYDLFEKTLGSDEEKPLLITSQDKGALDWTRDGKLILFATQSPKLASELWVLPATGDRKPYAVVADGSDNVQGQFSPDGKWLVYCSNVTGRYEVYLRSLDGRVSAKQISVEGGSYPRWSRDGRELYYLTRDNKLMAISVSKAGKELKTATPQALFTLLIPTGRNQGFGGYNSKANYVVSKDGRFLIAATAEGTATQPPLRLLRDWIGLENR